jgi:PASTA domain
MGVAVAITDPFKGMSKGAKVATAIGGVGVVGFVLFQRHSQTGSWNPFSSATPAAASDGATPDASSATVSGSTADTSLLGTDDGGGTGDLAAIPGEASSVDLSTSSPYTLNATYPNAAAWAQAAQAGLTSIGYDPTTVAAALGAYIAQQPLTAAQESIVQVAVAEYGTTTGPNGAPLQILTQPASTTTPPVPTPAAPKPATTDVTVPNVAGMDADQAETVLRSEHLNPKITLTASSDKKGIDHIITKTSPAAGKKVAPNTTVVLYYRDQKS